MKKTWLTIGFFCLVTALLLAPAAANAADMEKNLRIGANPPGTNMYAFSGGISQIVEKYTDLKIELLPQGNITAFPMIPSKEIDLIMSAADELDAAYMGKDIYEKITGGKGADVRVLMLGTRAIAGLLVPDDIGIKGCADLKGKRVVLDYGTQLALNLGSRAALYGCGLTEKDVIVVKATLIPDAVRKVMDGKADVAYGSIGVPAFRELDAIRGARHLSIQDTPENWKKIHEIYKGYFPMTVKKSPANFSVKEDQITMVGRHFSVIARTTLSDDTAYKIVKTLWEHDTELKPFHPELGDWVKEHFANKRASAPYHPGAIKFYKEVGAWTPELEQHNTELLNAKKK